jgi:hypothetical protein
MNHHPPAGGFTSLPPGGQDLQDLDQAAATAAAALSQEHAPTPNGNSRKRKAPTSVPGSRGVANLTPEQLAKKRANDREAQRAIRQRTKDTIDTLANRIKELESQQPFQELQKVVQERDRALQECEELRKKLATVASVIGGNGGEQQQAQQQQPNLHGMLDAFEQYIDSSMLTESGAELAAVTAQQSPLPPLNTATSPHAYPQPQASAGAQYEQHQQHIHPDLRSPHSATGSSPGSQGASVSSAYHSDGPGMRRWSPGADQPTSHYSPPNGIPYEQRAPQPPQMQPQSNGERLGLNYVLEPKQHPPRQSPPVPPPSQYTSSPLHTQPLYLRLPNNAPPSCPLDSLLLDFFAGRRQKFLQGVPMKDVAGPEYPYLYALLEPAAVYSKHCHPVSALLIDILSKFPYIDAEPEKVAVLYIMFLVLRWEICPCEKCFEQIPLWARPTKEQLEIPHPAWYDHVPWYVHQLASSFKQTNQIVSARPIIRTNLTLLNRIKFEDFFIPFTTRLCLNWPYPKDQVLIPKQPPDPEDPNALSMNPVFESHLRDLGNWSLGTQFRADLGELIDESVRIQDVGVGMQR